MQQGHTADTILANWIVNISLLWQTSYSPSFVGFCCQRRIKMSINISSQSFEMYILVLWRKPLSVLDSVWWMCIFKMKCGLVSSLLGLFKIKSWNVISILIVWCEVNWKLASLFIDCISLFIDFFYWQVEITSKVNPNEGTKYKNKNLYSSWICTVLLHNKIQ